MKKTISILLMGLISTTVFAGVTDDGSGLDRFNTGNWSSNFGSWRDNIDANGDTWLASNMGHVIAEDGVAGAPSFVGIYRGSTGDTAELFYSFTAADAIESQDWQVKGTVLRSTGGFAARLQFQVNVNGGGWTTVGYSDYFGDTASGATVDMGSAASGFYLDGPEALYSADLSGLGIAAGDEVVYKFRMPQNDGGGYGQAKRVGLGVQLGNGEASAAVPEPATMALLALGGLGVISRRRKK